MAASPFEVKSLSAHADGQVAVLDTPYGKAARAFVVGVGGAISIQTVAGNTLVLPVVNAGVLYPIGSTQINTTGTTATGLVVLF